MTYRYPAVTIRWPHVDPTPGQGHRLWTNIGSTQGQRIVPAGYKFWVCGPNLAELDTTLAATNQVSREIVDALHQNTLARHPATSSVSSDTLPDIPITPLPPVGFVLPTRSPLVFCAASIPSLLQAVPPMRHCAPLSPPRAQGTWPAVRLPPLSPSSLVRRKLGPRKPRASKFQFKPSFNRKDRITLKKKLYNDSGRFNTKKTLLCSRTIYIKYPIILCRV